MKDIIRKYVGQTIGCNIENATAFRPVVVVDTTDTCFSVKAQDTIFHFPYGTIVYVAESPDRFKLVTGNFSRSRVSLVIQVRPLDVQGLGIGVGLIF